MIVWCFAILTEQQDKEHHDYGCENGRLSPDWHPLKGSKIANSAGINLLLQWGLLGLPFGQLGGFGLIQLGHLPGKLGEITVLLPQRHNGQGLVVECIENGDFTVDRVEFLRESGHIVYFL